MVLYFVGILMIAIGVMGLISQRLWPAKDEIPHTANYQRLQVILCYVGITLGSVLIAIGLIVRAVGV